MNYRLTIRRQMQADEALCKATRDIVVEYDTLAKAAHMAAAFELNRERWRIVDIVIETD